MKSLCALLGTALAAGCGGAATRAEPDPTEVLRPAEEPLASRALDGPYQSLEQFCDQLETQNRRAVTAAEPVDDEGRLQEMSAKDAAELENADRLDCRLNYYYEGDEDADYRDGDDEEFFGFDVPVSGPTQSGGADPILEAQVVPFGEGDARCRMALRTASGWYVQQRGTPCADESGDLRTEVVELAVRDVLAGGDPELIWRYVTTRQAEAAEEELETMVLCGVGDSGVPHCYDGLVVAGRLASTTGGDGDADEAGAVGGTLVERSFRLEVQYGTRGIAVHGDLSDAATLGAETAARFRARLGRHPIEFD